MATVCPTSTECGGCPQIDLALSVQRRHKLEQLRGLLAAAKLVASPTLHPKLSRLDYRNRVRLQVSQGGMLGFFNARKSEGCAVLRTDLLETLGKLRLVCAERPSLFVPFAHAELRAADLDGISGLLLSPKDLKWSREDAISWEARAHPHLPDQLLLDYRIQSQTGAPRARSTTLSRGTRTQRFSLQGNTYQHVPLNGFIQVNPEINRALVARVVELAGAIGATGVLDLYCGSGNFLLPLAAAGLQVCGVELNSESVASAQKSLQEQSLKADVFSGTVEDCLRTAKNQPHPELVIADPPRAGLQNALPGLLRIAPQFLLICSCNPESLISDLRSLTLEGYRIRTMELFDMFAHTNHIEVLALLEKVRAPCGESRAGDGRSQHHVPHEPPEEYP